MLTAIPLAILVVPAMALAIANKWLPVGAALVLLALPVTWVIWQAA
ncbi:MAG TPA: hypothetical protein VFV47_11920 [Hyphomicrobiaceae bacterium]|nr:hypothetical protein [Hyphomicrobiaceae bacterium]